MPSPNSAEYQRRTEELRRLLTSAVAATTAEGILLSGGLDTSILAILAATQGRRLRAVTVAVADAPSPDEPFARTLAERLGIELELLRPTLGDLVELMPEVIRLLRTFDPMELRNSVVTFLALKAARAASLAAVLTGDAADELFAGYSFMFNAPEQDIPHHVRRMNDVMRFSSIPMGAALGVKAELPFLDKTVRAFALTLTAADLVGERDGCRFGKKILRQTFAPLLSEEFTERVKTPIEHGSGSTKLARVMTESVSDQEFESARQGVARNDGVRLRDKEQYFYYRFYRQIFPPPHELGNGVKACRECQGPLSDPTQRYCRLCGAYPA